MKILKHSPQKTTIKYTISVDKDYWKELQEKKLKQLAKTVKLAGFRAGRVPFSVAKQRIGEGDIINAALREAIDHNYRLLLQDPSFKDNELLEDALSVDLQKAEKDVLEIDYVFEKYPKITLPDYKKIDVNFKKTQVEENEVNGEINRLIKKDIMLVPKESSIVEFGDMVNFDFDGSVDGKSFSGGEAKGYELEIGSHQFIPGFEEQMIGLKKNTSKTIEVKFPKDYHATEMAGKDASFKIKINDIKTINKPTIDEKYLSNLNIPNVKTEEELRTLISDNIRNYKGHQSKQEATKAISDFIAENTAISYWPESLVNSEVKRINEDTEKNAKQAGVLLDDYIVSTLGYKNHEVYEKQVTEIAKRNLTIVMALEKIIEELKLEVTQSELQSHLNKMGKMYNLKDAEIKQRIKDNYEGVKTFILQEKVFDELIKLNTK
ncbi:MAG: trigger factor [Mycoplasmataceae bacterium]|nr:trigger factor [Mycoplasmataceae bacterium]